MINEKVKEIDNYILKLNTWWGLHSPGVSGTIITNDKLYSYQEYHHNPFEDVDDEKINYLKEKDIDNNTLKKIKDYIEENLINLESSSRMIFDAGFEIHVKYQGKEINIINNKELYDKTRDFLFETLKNHYKN